MKSGSHSVVFLRRSCASWTAFKKKKRVHNNLSPDIMCVYVCVHIIKSVLIFEMPAFIIDYNSLVMEYMWWRTTVYWNIYLVCWRKLNWDVFLHDRDVSPLHRSLVNVFFSLHQCKKVHDWNQQCLLSFPMDTFLPWTLNRPKKAWRDEWWIEQRTKKCSKEKTKGEGRVRGPHLTSKTNLFSRRRILGAF